MARRWRRPKGGAGAGSAPPGCLYAFLAVFVLFGLGFAFAGFALPAWRLHRAGSWTETPCTILESEVEAHSSSDGTTYGVRVVYRYEVDGVEHVSDRYGVSKISSSGRAGKQRIVDALPPGTATTCLVDPDDPTEAILRRAWQGEWILGLVGLVFATVGAGFMLLVRRRSRRSVGAKTAFAVSGGSRAADHDLSVPKASASTLALREARADEGPLALVSGTRRKAQVIFLGVFTAFWNGVTWPLLGSELLGVRRLSDLPGAAFAAIFVAVGLFVAGLFVYQLLVLFNPRPELTLACGRLVPGTRTEVRWQIRGRTRALSSLTITLEGRELATYTRGTDTHTDTHVFHRTKVVDTGRHGLIADGRAELAVPAAAIPSFAARHNELQWLLVVAGEIDNWPDLKEEYVLWVQPLELRA